MNIKLFNIPVIENKGNHNEGQLAFFEDAKSYLGEINRVYNVFNASAGVIRGHHAHKSLQQLIFCAHGKIKLVLNDGNEIIEVILDHPSKFLYLGPMIWRTMEWIVDNSVLVVLASENYDESDYIRDYDKFLRIVENEKNSFY